MSAEGPPGMRVTLNRDVRAKAARVVIVEVTEEIAIKDYERGAWCQAGNIGRDARSYRKLATSEYAF